MGDVPKLFSVLSQQLTLPCAAEANMLKMKALRQELSSSLRLIDFQACRETPSPVNLNTHCFHCLWKPSCYIEMPDFRCMTWASTCAAQLCAALDHLREPPPEPLLCFTSVQNILCSRAQLNTRRTDLTRCGYFRVCVMGGIKYSKISFQETLKTQLFLSHILSY